MTPSKNQYELPLSLDPRRDIPFHKKEQEQTSPILSPQREETLVAPYLATRIFLQRPESHVSNLNLNFPSKAMSIKGRSLSRNPPLILGLHESPHLIQDIFEAQFTHPKRNIQLNLTDFFKTITP